MGPNSDMVMDEFVFDPATNLGKILAEVTKGVFRFVTGKMRPEKPGDMKVKGPFADNGIRGTDFSVQNSQVGTTGTATTTVQSGTVEVTDNRGNTTVLTAGQELTITDSVPPLFAAVLPSSRSVQAVTIAAPSLAVGNAQAAACAFVAPSGLTFSEYRVTITGTATGPVGGQLIFRSNLFAIFADEVKSCGAWPNCVRGAGQPEITSWTWNFGFTAGSRPFNYGGATVDLVDSGSFIIASAASGPLTCQ